MARKITAFTILLLIFCTLSFPVSAHETNPYLIDEAELLTDQDKQILTDRLAEVSERHKVDIVILTVKTIGDKTPAEYADDYFDYNGYGYGENYDGILLLVNMSGRDCYISTSGAGISAMTDSRIESTIDTIRPHLSSGNYFAAFALFTDRCDGYITIEENKNSDADSEFKETSNIIAAIVAGAIFLTIIIVFIILSIAKPKTSESNSTTRGNRSHRSHGYRTGIGGSYRSRGGGYSSTHISSSGRTHGGGGRGF